MRTYLALSVVAPAGDQIRAGLKRLEVRKWKPDTLPLRDLLIIQNHQRLSRTGLHEDLAGEVVALVDVVAVREWPKEDLAAACAVQWEPGWLAWELENVRPLDHVGAVPARLRLYEIELTDEQGAVKIRPYSSADKTELLNLWWDAWHSSSGFPHPRPLTEWIPRFDALREKTVTFVAEDEKVLLGFIMINIPEKVVAQIFVLPGCQRSGVGRQLMQLAFQHLPDGFSLSVLETSTGVRRFYESFGMTAGERHINPFNGHYEVTYRTGANGFLLAGDRRA